MLTLISEGSEYDVVRGSLTMPRAGAWTADLFVSAVAPLAGAAKLTLDGVEMPCHVQRAEMEPAILHLRLVAGNGGLGGRPKAKHYHAPTVGHVFSDLVMDAGELQAPTSDRGLLGTGLNAWTTMSKRTTVGVTIQALCDTASSEAVWRVLYDGKVWIGYEKWPACPADVRIMSVDGANAAQVLGTDALGIWPGTTIDGRRVDSVEHIIGTTNRSIVHWAEQHK